MAIQINLENSKLGIPFDNAYCRIVLASLSRQREDTFSVMIDVFVYAQQPTNDETMSVEFIRYNTPLDEVSVQPGANFLAKCYNWVSQQPNMAGNIAV